MAGDQGYYLYGPQKPGTTGPRYPKPHASKRLKPPKRPVRPVRKPYVDPLAPIGEDQLRAKATSLVQQALSPLIQQASDAAERRAHQGTQDIQGFTNTFAQNLAQYADRAKAAFGQATQASAANQDALRALLSGAGSSLSSELAGKLGQIGAPEAATQQVAGGAATMGTGAANAGYASGAATTEKLIAQGANEQGYANTLPGVVALRGQQNVQELQAQTSQQLADKIAEIQSQAPGMAAQLFEHLVDNEFQKALARQSGQFKGAQLTQDAVYKAQQTAYHKAILAYDKAKSKADRAEKAREARRRAAIAGKNAQTSAQRAAEQRRHDRQVELETRRHHKKTESKKGKSGSGSSSSGL
jgi:hypothetical protein